jgi:hypothetical protein
MNPMITSQGGSEGFVVLRVTAMTACADSTIKAAAIAEIRALRTGFIMTLISL